MNVVDLQQTFDQLFKVTKKDPKAISLNIVWVVALEKEALKVLKHYLKDYPAGITCSKSTIKTTERRKYRNCRTCRLGKAKKHKE